MRSDWHKCRWGDAVTIEYGKSLRGYQDAVGEYRVYGTNGPIGWHDKPLCTHPSVIIGRKGAYRGIHYSPEPFFVIDTAFYLEPKEDIDVRWAYYCLLTYDINGMDSGSAIPSTSREAFYNLPVRIPPKSEQSAIAKTLGTLDDKIELNRRIDETLESIARAIFKAWFVDFDPVRAKADGRQPAGMDAETAALFPNSFEDSPIGKIPTGWVFKALDEAIEINPCRPLQKGELAPFLEMKNMPTYGHRPIAWLERAFSSGTRFINGDTLVARITPCLENGKTAFVDFLQDGQTGWGSTEYIVLRPKPPLSQVYGYFLARSEDFRSFAIQSMTGTSGRQRVQTSSLTRYMLPIPTIDVAKEFSRLAEPLMQLIRANDMQAGTLSAIRDTLLPKLIYGEIRVKDTEKFVEEHAG